MQGAPADGERGEYILLVMMDTGEHTEAWTHWNIDHARDVVTRPPGFVAGRTDQARPEYAYIHPETLAARPPYDLVHYELDKDDLAWATTRRPEWGGGPAGGSSPFPAPLGPHCGDGYLLEALCQRFGPA